MSKLRLFKSLLSILILLNLLFPCLAATNNISSQPSVALFYGTKPPDDLLRNFNIAIVEPSSGINPRTYSPSIHNQLFAYVSVGEVSPDQPYYQPVQPWVIGHNPSWHTVVIDQCNPAWQQFFIKNIITPLWNQGYRGFFLDTLDSYQLATKTTDDQTKQRAGLEQLILNIKKHYPDAKLIFNRGFELLPTLHQYVYAVAAESLFQSWDQATNTYKPVSSTDHAELLKKLQVAQQYKLPIIVIDYVPANQSKLAQATADKIKQLGFIPWVANNQLNIIGVSNIKPLPRKILVLYSNNQDNNLESSNAFHLATLPLNYLGYIPEFYDIKKPLPQNILSNEYAGILVWADSSTIGQKQNLHDWLLQRIKQGMKVAIIGNFGFPMTVKNLQPFGIIIPKNYSNNLSTQRIIYQSTMMGYEIKPLPEIGEFLPLHLQKGDPLLKVADGNNQIGDMAAITAWGGYVLAPFDTKYLPNQQTRWVINPFKFFTDAWRLPLMPVPDTTTENGRRLMTVHVDGDAFISPAEWDTDLLAAEVMKKQIFDHYQIPTTVSVITGEIASNGIDPAHSAQYLQIAKDIFNLPWIEIASHTYSHPFDWKQSLAGKSGSIYNLPIPHYQFNENTEVIGSIEYINKYLAPPDKKCKVLLWPGDCNPSDYAVSLTYKDQVANLNGGNTIITDENNSISNVAPLGIVRGSYFQVYAPNQNENLYTNNWRGPFYGYHKVIQTFQLTDKPIRLKPIDIYYHFYSATKLASLQALKDVYNWALTQPVMNIYISDYFKKVLDYNYISIAQSGDGWIIHNQGHLRELRLPKKLGYPNLSKSYNIVGFNAYNQDTYVHLGPDTETYLYLMPALISADKSAKLHPYLLEANGWVSEFNLTSTGIDLRLHAYLPLKFTIANAENCSITSNNHLLIPSHTLKGAKTFELPTQDSGKLSVKC